MEPRPPAFDTAATSSGVVVPPAIGAWMIPCWAPSSSASVGGVIATRPTPRGLIELGYTPYSLSIRRVSLDGINVRLRSRVGVNRANSVASHDFGSARGVIERE